MKIDNFYMMIFCLIIDYPLAVNAIILLTAIIIIKERSRINVEGF